MKCLPYKRLHAPEVLNKAASADGLRDMQGLAARFFGRRSAAEPEVARTKVDGWIFRRQPQKNYELRIKNYDMEVVG